MRKSTLTLSLLAGLVVLLIAALGHAALYGSDAKVLETRQTLVGQLGLSDLALFTEARYTRHPSMADLHTAFQDHPISLDHFPTGSLIAPPPFKRSKSAILPVEKGSESHATLD